MTSEPPVTAEEPEQLAAEPPTLLERQQALTMSAGYRAVALMDRVKRIAYIFQANVAQYKSLVAKMHNLEFALPILDIHNPGAHDDLLSEAERLLHNVITAMSTRVDQQRAFMEKHFADDAVLTAEYRKRIADTFLADLPTKFLKDLRNHIAHHLLPVAQSNQTYSSESFGFTFILPTAPLLEWDWTGRSVKDWISSQGDAVAIVDVVDDYARKVGDFDKWLHDRIGLKFEAEIQEYWTAAEEFNRLVDRAFGV